MKMQPRLLKFAPTNDLILRKRCHELTSDEIYTQEIQDLIDNMFYTMTQVDRGVGLSANQIGRLEAIAAVTTKPTPARPDLSVMNKAYINPKIVKTYGEKELMWEGCLSTAADENGEPMMAQVPRFPKIKIEYASRDGEKVCEVIDGFIAHVLQHEIDHLKGVLFTDYINQEDLISYREFKKLAVR